MYTVLRVAEGGRVPLFDAHVRRLGAASRGALRSFTHTAPPGVYRALWSGVTLTTEPRPSSRLVEGMPTRFATSPFAQRRGRFAKPPPPSLYDSVRVPGTSTLLTSNDGRELYESCSASVLSWDGEELVLAPLDAPGVASLAEEAVVRALPHHRERLLVVDDAPLLLINAVAGTCSIAVPGRRTFPPDVRARIDAVLNR